MTRLALTYYINPWFQNNILLVNDFFGCFYETNHFTFRCVLIISLPSGLKDETLSAPADTLMMDLDVFLLMFMCCHELVW